MKSTLGELLFFLTTLTADPLPEDLPTLMVVPPAAMPCKCEAAYDEGKIYVRNDINWQEPRWLSVIVHELEHHRQFLKYGTAKDCDDWVDREWQAHQVQTLYLERSPTSWRPIMMASCR